MYAIIVMDEPFPQGAVSVDEDTVLRSRRMASAGTGYICPGIQTLLLCLHSPRPQSSRTARDTSTFALATQLIPWQIETFK